MFKKLILVALALTPTIILASGLVPCGGAGEPICQACNFVQMINLVVTWLVQILGIIVTIMIIVAGLRLVTSGGDASAKTKAKTTITNFLIGYVIVLAGWLLVDTLLKTFVDGAAYGMWNTIQCVDQPQSQMWSRTTASGDNVSDLPPVAVASRVSAINSSGSLQTDITAAAAATGITDPNKVDILRGLISQESSNCGNKTGPATGSGTAYGCGQLLVSTARTLDPTLAGMSDSDVAAKLRDDNTYNVTLSAKYYGQLLNKYSGNTDLALAAYNGGPGANLPSADCPGLKRWQCVWDSPGCYGTGKTDCAKNEGPDSYAQTRHYVSNINAIADSL